MSEDVEYDPAHGTPQEQAVGFAPLSWINGMLRKMGEVVNEVVTPNPNNKVMMQLQETRKALAELAAVSSTLTDSENKLQEIEKILAIDQSMSQMESKKVREDLESKIKSHSLSKEDALKATREKLRKIGEAKEQAKAKALKNKPKPNTGRRNNRRRNNRK
jgi:Asp-tRNA(Asn)/Glu-tRNA(Gln) amidotransferase C subunit